MDAENPWTERLDRNPSLNPLDKPGHSERLDPVCLNPDAFAQDMGTRRPNPATDLPRNPQNILENEAA